MFLKRLSIALSVLMCFSGFVMGTNSNTSPDAKQFEEETALAAPLIYGLGIIDSDAVSCHDGNNGYVKFEVIDGTGPYRFKLEKEGGVEVFPWGLNSNREYSSLKPGNYIIYVQDQGNGNAQASIKFTLANPNPLTLSINGEINYPKCSIDKGSLTVVAGGSSGYTYYIKELTSSVPVNNTTGVFSGLGNGSYQLWVEVSGPCKTYLDQNVVITVPAPIDFTVAETQIKCDNDLGSVKLSNLPVDAFEVVLENTTTGNFYSAYTNSGPLSRTYSDLPAGSYSVTVTRSNCTTDSQPESFTIAPFAEVNITTTLPSPHTLSCGGASDFVDIDFTVNGGNPARQVRVVLDDGDLNSTDPEHTIRYGESNTFANVKAGNYNIRWTDVANPTCNGSKPYLVSSPASYIHFTGLLVGVSPSCNGESDGTIQIPVTGGTKPYTYYVNGTSYSQLADIQLLAGSYNVSVTDNNGCETDLLPVIIPPVEQITANLVPGSKTPVTCPEGSDGSFAIKINGGNGNYLYDLTNSSGTLSRTKVSAPDSLVVSNLPVGFYDIIIYDQKGCSVPALSVEVEGPSPLAIATLTYDALVCPGSTTDIAVSATEGGVSTYTYQLLKAGSVVDEQTGSSANFSGVTPSVYTLRVIGNTACALLNTIIEIKTSMAIVPYNFSDSIMVNCQKEMGELFLRINGGAYSFKYELDNSGVIKPFDNQGNTTITDLDASPFGYSHSLTITDANGCEKDIDFTVYSPEPLSSLPVEETNISCYEKKDGKIEFEVSGGTPGYEAILIHSDGGTRRETSSDGLFYIDNVREGDFTIEVKDKNGCTLGPDLTATIVRPERLTIDNPDIIVPVTCYGDIAEVILSVSGGWEVSNSIQVVGNGINTIQDAGTSFYLPQGTYTASISNENNCNPGKHMFTVPGPKAVSIIVNYKNVSCAGADDASITITASGGTPGGYSYGLGGLGSADVSFLGNSVIIDGGLSAGNYEVFVSDVNLCPSNVVPVTITEPAPITFETIVDSVSCFGGDDGRIRLTKVDGGSGQGYSSYISTGGAETQKTLDIKGLVKNTYTVVVSDNSGTCRSEPVVVEIKQPDEIVINGVEKEDIKCFNVNEGYIKINAQGGTPYDLEYRITKEPDFDSGYSSINEFKNLAFGIYTAWVRNTKGNCAQAYADKITINNADELRVNTPIVTNVSCHNLHDGQVKIEANGGTGTLTYTLTNTAPAPLSNTDGTFTGLGDVNKTVTTYEFRVEDGNGCSKTGSFQVRNPEQIKLEVAGRTEIQCNDDVNGTLTLLVTGGTVGAKSSYSISDYDNPSIAYQTEKINDSRFVLSKLGNKALVASYNPIATDDNGCQTELLAQVVEFINPAKVVIESITMGEKLCHGDVDDKTIIHASGGTGKFYYSLDNGTKLSELNDSTFVGEKAGTKRPYVKDENGCEATFKEYEYLEPLALEVEYTFFPIQCYDDEFGNVVLKIKGGTGGYQVNYNSSNFDSNVHEISRSQLDVTTFDFHKNEINLTDDITYKFYLRDANNCHVQNVEGVNNYTKPFASTVFTKPQKLVLDKLDQRMVTCRNENTGVILFEASGGTISATNGYTLTTTNVERGQVRTNVLGSDQVDKLFAGLHRCILTDANGCIGETRMSPLYEYDTITVAYQNESIFLEIAEIIQPHCNETYEGVLKINVADYSQDGVVAKVDYYNGALDVFYIFDRDDTIKAEIDYATGLDTDNPLYFANSKTVAENMGVGRYVVYVEDIYTGCSASIDTTIISKFGDDCREINYYNVFTPHNGDDLHENWTIRGSQHQKYALQIYTPYGEMVYSREGVADGEGVKWNGVDNKDRPVPVGTYIYLLNKYKGSKRDTFINGNITILRGDGRR